MKIYRIAMGNMGWMPKELYTDDKISDDTIGGIEGYDYKYLKAKTAAIKEQIECYRKGLDKMSEELKAAKLAGNDKKAQDINGKMVQLKRAISKMNKAIISLKRLMSYSENAGDMETGDLPVEIVEDPELEDLLNFDDSREERIDEDEGLMVDNTLYDSDVQDEMEAQRDFEIKKWVRLI